MRILFIIPFYKPAYCYGGPIVAVSLLAEMLATQGHKITVYTTTANGHSELSVSPGVAIIVNKVTVYYFKRVTKGNTFVSPALWLKLWKTCKMFDIVHLNTWWNFLIIGAGMICRIKKIVYVVSPRGMLSDYTFNNHHIIIKRILHKVIGKRLLNYSKLHATSLMEWKECLHVHNGWKGFMLYNLIDLPTVKIHNKETSVFTIGFLSRIYPKKGLDILFHALAKVTFDFRLLIAGTGDDKYISYLKTLASEIAIDKKIYWNGFREPEDKFLFFGEINLLALISLNENFAMVVGESLAAGTPVLISENVGLADYVKEKQIGWTCKANVQSVYNELTIIYKNRDKLHIIKNFAPTIIAQDFDKKKLAQKYINCYLNILDNKELL